MSALASRDSSQQTWGCVAAVYPVTRYNISVGLSLRCRVTGTLWMLCHAKVVRSGRTFLRRMFELLKGTSKKQHFIHLNTSFHSDLMWWNLFLESWNGISMLEDPAWKSVPFHWCLRLLRLRSIVRPNVDWSQTMYTNSNCRVLMHFDLCAKLCTVYINTHVHMSNEPHPLKGRPTWLLTVGDVHFKLINTSQPHQLHTYQSASSAAYIPVGLISCIHGWLRPACNLTVFLCMHEAAFPPPAPMQSPLHSSWGRYCMAEIHPPVT